MLRLNEAQLAEMVGRHKGRVHILDDDTPATASRSKYRNRRFRDIDGLWWDSAKEYQRWQDLRLLETAGKIERLERQVRFDLLPPKPQKNGKMRRAVRYVADFVYYEDGQRVVEDAKGFRNKLYELKKRLMWQLLGIEVFET